MHSLQSNEWSLPLHNMESEIYSTIPEVLISQKKTVLPYSLFCYNILQFMVGPVETIITEQRCDQVKGL